MPIGRPSRRSLKICCGVTTLVIILLAVTLIILFLTILKPKQPKVQAHPVSLNSIELEVFPVLKLNLTLGILVSVKNPNVGRFKYEKTAAVISYRGDVIAEAPLEAGVIPSRGTQNLTTAVEILADKMIANKDFLGDILGGRLNFTSASTLHGKVTLIKIVKFSAKARTTCDISIFLNGTIDSNCRAKVKL